jgi:hypothetical protein
MNWLTDQAPRVARTIRRIVDEVKDAIQDAIDIWNRLRAVLDRALMPHPQARVAVIQAIDEELLLTKTG